MGTRTLKNDMFISKIYLESFLSLQYTLRKDSVCTSMWPLEPDFFCEGGKGVSGTFSPSLKWGDVCARKRCVTPILYLWLSGLQSPCMIGLDYNWRKKLFEV